MFKYLTYQQNVKIQFACCFAFQAQLVSFYFNYKMLHCSFLVSIALFCYIEDDIWFAIYAFWFRMYTYCFYNLKQIM